MGGGRCLKAVVRVPGLMRGNWKLHLRQAEVSPNFDLTTEGVVSYTPSMIIWAQLQHRLIVASIIDILEALYSSYIEINSFQSHDAYLIVSVL